MKKAPVHLRPRTSSGLSLIESVLAVVVVSVLVVASLNAAGAAARTRLKRSENSAAMALARELMGEIMHKAFFDPKYPGSTGLGPGTDETRATYDDVNDYHNLTESPPVDPWGNPIPGYSGWSRTVQISWVDPASLAEVQDVNTGLKRITVTVASPGGQITRLVGLRSAGSAYDKIITRQQTYAAQSIVTLQAGNDPAAKVVSGVNLLNQTP